MKNNKEKLVVPALRGSIGDWVYYSSLMNANQITEWIETAKNIREAKSLEEVLQRELKPRIKNIANYLKNDNARFFNSIIIGVFDGVPDWVEFDMAKADNIIDDINAREYIKQSFGLLVFQGNEKMFAIDGQHRVEGIKQALQENKNKEVTADQFSVIFIAHTDTKDGMKRSRKLFSDINKNAKPVSKGDKVIIDEQELNAITARRIFAEYKYFENGKLIAPSENAKLDKDDVSHFTNLLAIYKVCSILKPLFKKEPKTLDFDENNVTKLQAIVTDFFDFIIENLPEYKAYFISKTLTLTTARHNNSYLAFRPIGLFLLARIWLHFKKTGNIDTFKNKLTKLSFILPASPFNEILWVKGKIEPKEFNQKFAVDFGLYLLGEETNKENLVNRYQTIMKNQSINLPNVL